MKIQNTNDLEEQGKDRGKDKLPGSRKITSRFPGKQHLCFWETASQQDRGKDGGKDDVGDEGKDSGKD